MSAVAESDPVPKTGEQSRALIWVALGAGLWGTDTLFRKSLTSTLSSSQIVFYEHLILTALLLPYCWTRRQILLGLSRMEWAAILGIAWGGSALGTVFFTEAIRTGNPTTAVLLQKIQPVFAALLASLLLGEPLARRFWLCLAAALAAGYLVSFGTDSPFQAAASTPFVPALLALAAAAIWGGSTVLGRFALHRLPFPLLTAVRITAAAPMLAILVAAGRQPVVLPADGPRITSLLLMALVPGLLALLLYYRGLGKTRASLAAIAELSFPATATLLNWLVLDARVSPAQMAGFALLWVVILYLDRCREPEKV